MEIAAGKPGRKYAERCEQKGRLWCRQRLTTGGGVVRDPTKLSQCQKGTKPRYRPALPVLSPWGHSHFFESHSHTYQCKGARLGVIPQQRSFKQASLPPRPSPSRLSQPPSGPAFYASATHPQKILSSGAQGSTTSQPRCPGPTALLPAARQPSVGP